MNISDKIDIKYIETIKHNNIIVLSNIIIINDINDDFFNLYFYIE